MAQTTMFRPETRTYVIATVVPAATGTVDIAIPDGAYHFAIAVKSSVTGTTTTVALRPFVDEGLTQANGVDLEMTEPDDSSTVTVLTLPAGAAGRYASVISNSGSVPFSRPTQIIGGLQFTITKGGATTGELLEATLIATRVG